MYEKGCGNRKSITILDKLYGGTMIQNIPDSVVIIFYKKNPTVCDGCAVI